MAARNVLGPIEDDNFPKVTDTPKKRKTHGSVHDQKRDAQLYAHVSGPDCRCQRLKCFTITTLEERDDLIDTFNALDTKNAQDGYLALLITVYPVKDSRAKKTEQTPVDRRKPQSDSFGYSVDVTRGPSPEKLNVCLNAFVAIFGISKKRVEVLRNKPASKS